MSGVFVGTSYLQDVADGDTMRKCNEISAYFTRLRLRIGFERGDFSAAAKQARIAKNAITKNTPESEDAILDLAEIYIRGGNMHGQGPY